MRIRTRKTVVMLYVSSATQWLKFKYTYNGIKKLKTRFCIFVLFLFDGMYKVPTTEKQSCESQCGIL